MGEERATQATTHGRRQNPKVIEMQSVALSRQHVKPDWTIIFDRAIGDIRLDEFRAHGQNIAPLLDPPLGITPMPLRRESDGGQGIGIFRLGADNLHLLCLRASFVSIARERIEICIAIVNVHAFGPLQFVHDEISHRRGKRFIEDFADVTGDDQIEHCPP